MINFALIYKILNKILKLSLQIILNKVKILIDKILK